MPHGQGGLVLVLRPCGGVDPKAELRRGEVINCVAGAGLHATAKFTHRGQLPILDMSSAVQSWAGEVGVAVGGRRRAWQAGGHDEDPLRGHGRGPLPGGERAREKLGTDQRSSWRGTKGEAGDRRKEPTSTKTSGVGADGLADQAKHHRLACWSAAGGRSAQLGLRDGSPVGLSGPLGGEWLGTGCSRRVGPRRSKPAPFLDKLPGIREHFPSTCSPNRSRCAPRAVPPWGPPTRDGFQAALC